MEQSDKNKEEKHTKTISYYIFAGRLSGIFLYLSCMSKIFKPCIFFYKGKSNISYRTIPLLPNNNLSHPFIRIAIFIPQYSIILWTIKEKDNICILFNRT